MPSGRFCTDDQGQIVWVKTDCGPCGSLNLDLLNSVLPVSARLERTARGVVSLIRRIEEPWCSCGLPGFWDDEAIASCPAITNVADPQQGTPPRAAPCAARGEVSLPTRGRPVKQTTSATP